MNYDYLLYSSVRYSFNRDFLKCGLTPTHYNKNYNRDFLKCGLTPTHYNKNYNYVLVGTALKTAM